ncbi:MAG TPA: hypothetical protein VEH27_08670 [Methylomirabilota bacterium]|nr:hypothetical protein [Methylomirabilota bacterium]
MSADQIIEDIKHLPREEQSRVVQFAVELARTRQATPERLAQIATEMLATTDASEKKRLEAELTSGFFGD